MQQVTHLITALDVDTREKALGAVRSIGDCLWVKVGSQLFTRYGPDIVAEIRGLGKRVFLDLKFHDIPNTVAKAAQSAAGLSVSLITVHAAGGRRMIAAAREAVEGSDTRILAVTVLTSLTDEMLRDEIGVSGSVQETVTRYAKLAIESGAHGIVCSPQEIELVRDGIGSDPIIVTPGVRPAWAGTDDQARFMTPREAARAGADYVVVGRPILKHQEPAIAVRLIVEELTR